MRIALITPTPPDISAFGVRALSALLKQEGHSVICLFLPGGIERLRHGRDVVYSYSSEALDDITAVLQDCAVIGISFMSQYHDRAVALTQHVRKTTRVLILWGGVHASVRPEESLAYADAVCIGEGDMPLTELSAAIRDGRDFLHTPSFFFRTNHSIQRNPIAPPVVDLDRLPPFDFALEGHYLLDPFSQRLKPMTPELLRTTLPLMPFFGPEPLTVYRTMTSRGCPHRCTYCANRHQRDLAGSEFPYLRWRNPDHVVNELLAVKDTYPFIQGIHFFDDVFAAMPLDRLQVFCQAYQRHIRLPFYCQVSPVVLNHERLELLLDAGMVFIEMGVQTGSPRIRKMYDRNETNEQILEAAQMIHALGDRVLTPRYHLILDNPWETSEDQAATLDLASRIPKPFIWCLSSLVLYPGTDLNQRAHQEGFLNDEESEIYRRPFYKVLPNLGNLLITLTDISWLPSGLIRCFNHPWLLRFGNILPFRIFAALGIQLRDYGRLSWKGLRAVLRGDFQRISAFFRRNRSN